jgi:hypothetical protein
MRGSECPQESSKSYDGRGVVQWVIFLLWLETDGEYCNSQAHRACLVVLIIRGCGALGGICGRG